MKYDIQWTPEQLDHIDRKQRHPHEVSITTVMLSEAESDPDLVVLDPDPKTNSGMGVRFIGYSQTAGGLLVVVAVRTENGSLWGATAYKTSANRADGKIYTAHKEEK